ncbi:hypothetical protein NIES4071_74920 [Calothrix sp. NIES-4071]|nr:hypothetical protein NIES4071_74920 [Calothrix sp. NIES-4071]BAZ61767.1 hypothetical protein NIES4105_74870 [Calothrix sp. NIES-4105]
MITRLHTLSTSVKLILPRYLNSLTISDLSYLQDINESSAVEGGNTNAVTATVTSSGPGYAIAGASSFASGQATYAGTQTNTNVQNIGLFKSSTADATARAFAQTGNQIAISSSSSTSIWLSITSP